MSQEIKLMVRPDIGGRQPVTAVEQEIAALSRDGGWVVKEVFHLGMEKSGSHNVMFVLVRNVGEPEPLAEAARRGRPPKVE
jgi:hypothetical protein